MISEKSVKLCSVRPCVCRYFVLSPLLAKKSVKEFIFLTTEMTILVTLLRQNRPFSLLLCRFLGTFMPDWPTSMLIDMRKCPTIRLPMIKKLGLCDIRNNQVRGR